MKKARGQCFCSIRNRSKRLPSSDFLIVNISMIVSLHI